MLHPAAEGSEVMGEMEQGNPECEILRRNFVLDQVPERVAPSTR
jgi:hypothetical protein